MKKLFLFLWIPFSSLLTEALVDWKVTLKDSLENTKVERIDKNWSDIQIPISFDQILHTKNKIIWLRKEINLEKNYPVSLIFDKINGFFDVYLNEVKIYSGPVIPGGSLLVQLPAELYRDDLNIIAIRFQMKSIIENGIFEPIEMYPAKEAVEKFYKKDIKYFFMSITYGGVGLYLLFLFLKFKNAKYYLFLSLFYIITSISSFFSNAYIYEFVIFPNFFYSLAMALPVLLPMFFIRFFSLYFKYLSKAYWIFKYDFYVSIIFFLIIFISGIFNVYWARVLNLLWIVLFVLVFVYCIYLILIDLSKNLEIKRLVILVFLTYLFANSFHSILNFNYFKQERFLYHLDVFIILLSPVFLIFWEIIELQRSLKRKEEQFVSFDILQTKIFDYILTALEIRIKEIIEILHKTPSKELTPNQSKNLIYTVEELEKNLNDILELSRLEVLEEPESYVEINVKDFLETILNSSSISYSINVDENLKLTTSLELVNSLLIRFIDFPGFGSFQHIDLVVLAEGNQLHFRFFFYNTNLKIVSRIYNIIKEKLPDQEGLWIQWKIIKEIIRILGGELNIKLYSKKYLYIEFFIQLTKSQNFQQKEKISEKKQVIPLVYLYYVENKNKTQKSKNQTFLEKIKELLKKKIA